MYGPYGYLPYHNYKTSGNGLYHMGDILNSCYNMYSADYNNNNTNNGYMGLRDYGPEPFVINIEDAAKINNTFRMALWTGNHLQLTLMSINPGEDIGLEVHPDLDQFIRIEQGQGIVAMGDRPDRPDFQRWVYPDYVIIIPAGKWHNLVNTGRIPIKLYSIYAPPQHLPGTVHVTRADAMAEE
jgi:mannose-6-phosphate isomerase-like protein (cupin superfamily)